MSISTATSSDSLASAKEELQAQVAIAKAISQGTYTNTSFATLTSAITSAETVLKNTSATKANLDNARVTIENAIKGLKVCTHAWDNACDTTCNACPYTRTISHTFTKQDTNSKYLKSEATCTAKAVYYKCCSVCALSSKGQTGEGTFTSGSVNTNKHTGSSVNGGTENVHSKYSCCGATISTQHSYTKTTEIKATCTTKGTSKYTCNCGYSYTAQDIPVIAHEFTKQDTNSKYLKSEATCTAKAVYYKSCEVCGLSSEGQTGEATFTSGNFADHDYGTWVEEIPAKPGESGTKGHYNCSICDKYFDIDKNEITDLTIPALPVVSSSSSSSESSQESSVSISTQESSSATSESESSSIISQEQSSVSSAISSSNSISSTEQSSSSSASVNSTSKTPTPSRGGCTGNVGISVFLLPMLALALVFIVKRTKKQ